MYSVVPEFLHQTSPGMGPDKGRRSNEQRIQRGTHESDQETMIETVLVEIDIMLSDVQDSTSNSCLTVNATSLRISVFVGICRWLYRNAIVIMLRYFKIYFLLILLVEVALTEYQRNHTKRPSPCIVKAKFWKNYQLMCDDNFLCTVLLLRC